MKLTVNGRQVESRAITLAGAHGARMTGGGFGGIEVRYIPE